MSGHVSALTSRTRVVRWLHRYQRAQHLTPAPGRPRHPSRTPPRQYSNQACTPLLPGARRTPAGSTRTPRAAAGAPPRAPAATSRRRRGRPAPGVRRRGPRSRCGRRTASAVARSAWTIAATSIAGAAVCASSRADSTWSRRRPRPIAGPAELLVGQRAARRPARAAGRTPAAARTRTTGTRPSSSVETRTDGLRRSRRRRPTADLLQRRRRALEHRGRPRAAQQRLRGLVGRGACAGPGRAASRRCRRGPRRSRRARPRGRPGRPAGRSRRQCSWHGRMAREDGRGTAAPTR